MDAPCWPPPRALSMALRQFLAAASALKQGQGSEVCFSAQNLECQSLAHQSGPWSGRGIWGSQSLASAAVSPELKPESGKPETVVVCQEGSSKLSKAIILCNIFERLRCIFHH